MHGRQIFQQSLTGYHLTLFFFKKKNILEIINYEQDLIFFSDLQDGLFLITNNLSLVEGNLLAILTPNVYEYKRLVQKVLNCEVNEENASEQLTALCQKYDHNHCNHLFFTGHLWCFLILLNRIGGITIMRKGKADIISDGKTGILETFFGYFKFWWNYNWFHQILYLLTIWYVVLFSNTSKYLWFPKEMWWSRWHSFRKVCCQCGAECFLL